MSFWSIALGGRGRFFLFVVLAILCTVMAYCGGCLGGAAMDNVAVPALVEVGPRIQEQALRGSPQDADTIGAFFEAVMSRDRERIVEARASWPIVRAAVEADIASRLEAGLIGPNVATELRVRLAEYQANLERLE